MFRTRKLSTKFPTGKNLYLQVGILPTRFVSQPALHHEIYNSRRCMFTSRRDAARTGLLESVQHAGGNTTREYVCLPADVMMRGRSPGKRAARGRPAAARPAHRAPPTWTAPAPPPTPRGCAAEGGAPGPPLGGLPVTHPPVRLELCCWLCLPSHL